MDKLIGKYMNGQLSDREWLIMDMWFESMDNEKEVIVWSEKEKEDVKRKILSKTHDSSTVIQTQQGLLHWGVKVAVAASIVVFLALGSYFLLERNNNGLPETNNFVLLELANKEKVKIGGKAGGFVLNQGETMVITKSENENRIVYKNKGGVYSYESDSIIFNRLTVPNGHQYSVVLPDGSEVWLNASSSVRYPVRFGDKRIVELEGEAFFDVKEKQTSKGDLKPFQVRVGDLNINVLGTRFNVRAYKDGGKCVTLIKGSVQISEGSMSELLRPGDQLVSLIGFNLYHGVDTNKVIGWKEGYFVFEQATIREVMRDLSRWYNIDEVLYNNVDDSNPYYYKGEIQRELSLLQVLKVLEASNDAFTIEHFEEEGKNLIVIERNMKKP